MLNKLKLLNFDQPLGLKSEQIVANTILIINISNSNNLNKF